MFEQFEPDIDGDTPPVLAIVPKFAVVIAVRPSACRFATGTWPVWHSRQAYGGLVASTMFTCARCWPTCAPLEAPVLSFGGAARWFASAPGTEA